MKKIVVIGPESTGKSSLCEALAKHYQSRWCPEFARQFLLEHGKEYNYEDLLTIAKGQLAMEDDYTADLQKISFGKSNAPVLFIDTDMYVMKVWNEFVFDKCHSWIIDQIITRKYDLYLLCNVDLPWVKDELREYPDLPTRKKLYLIYKDIMINQQTPWVDISGNYEDRLQKAIQAVDGILHQ